MPYAPIDGSASAPGGSCGSSIASVVYAAGAGSWRVAFAQPGITMPTNAVRDRDDAAEHPMFGAPADRRGGEVLHERPGRATRIKVEMLALCMAPDGHAAGIATDVLEARCFAVTDRVPADGRYHKGDVHAASMSITARVCAHFLRLTNN